MQYKTIITSLFYLSLRVLCQENQRQLLVTQDTLCFTPQPSNPYPQLLGGFNGKTEFHCVYYDEDVSRLLVGGSSSSSDIVNNVPAPLLIMINEPTGQVVWETQLNYDSSVSQVLPEQISLCNIQYGSRNYVLTMSDAPQFGIHIFSYSTGALVRSLYEVESGSIVRSNRKVVGGIIDSNQQVYFVTSETNTIKVSSFTFDSTLMTITPAYYKSYGSASTVFIGSCVTFDGIFSYLYVGGSVQGNPSMTKIYMANGISSFSYTVQAQGTSSQKLITNIDLTDILLVKFQLGCAQNLGSDQNDVAILQYTEALGAITTLAKSWYFNMNQKTSCLDLESDGVVSYFLFGQNNQRVLYAQSTIAATINTITLVEMRLSTTVTVSLYYQQAQLRESGTIAYYIGSTAQINSLVYTVQNAFVMKYPSTNCLNSQPAQITQSVSIQTLFILALGSLPIMNPASNTYSSTNQAITFKNISGMSNQPLLNIGLQAIPSECSSLMPPGLVVNPAHSDYYSYTITDPLMTISLADFTYTISCYDQSWTYQATLANGSMLPSFIQYTQLSYGNGQTFQILLNDSSLAGNYSIQVTGTINNAYSNSFTFILELLYQQETSTAEPSTSTFSPSTSSNEPSTSTDEPSISTEIPNSSTLEPITSTEQSSTQAPSTYESHSSTGTPTTSTTESPSSSSTESPLDLSSSTDYSTVTSTEQPTLYQTSTESDTSSLLSPSTESPTLISTSVTFSTSISSSTELVSTISSTIASQVVAPIPSSTESPLSSTYQSSSTIHPSSITQSSTNAPTHQQNTAPYFTQPLQDQITLYVQETFTLTFPKVKDQENDLVRLNISSQFHSKEIPSFITYSQSWMKISPKFGSQGTYRVIITLTDLNPYGPLETSYLITILVKPRPLLRNEIPIVNDSQTNNLPIREWDEDLTFEINSISPNGEIKLKFSELVQIDVDQLQDNDFFNITLEGRDYQLMQNAFIMNYTEDSITLQVDFSNVKGLSQSQDGDFIIIKIANASMIISKSSQKPINPKTQTRKRMPPQIDPNDSFTLSNFEDNLMEKVLMSAIYGSAAMSLTVGASLQVLWGMINTLELVTHSPLFQIPYSTNILYFLKSLLAVVNFDVFSSQKGLQEVFQLQSEDYYPPHNTFFEFLGYDNSIFIYLLGPQMFMLLGILMIVLVYSIISQLTYFWIAKFSEKLRKHFFFNVLLRVAIELTLESTFSGIVNLKQPILTSGGEFISLSLSAGFLALNLGLALSLPFIVSRLPKVQDEVTMSAQKYSYDELTEILNLHRKSSYFYYSVFIFRRLLFVTCTFLLDRNIGLQITIFMETNLIYLLYIFMLEPVKKDYLKTEAFNEICQLSLTWLMIFYTDYMTDSDIKEYCSYLFIAIYLFNIGCNLIIVLKECALLAATKIRRFIRINRVKLRLKKKVSDKRLQLNKSKVQHPSPSGKVLTQIPEYDAEETQGHDESTIKPLRIQFEVQKPRVSPRVSFTSPSIMPYKIKDPMKKRSEILANNPPTLGQRFSIRLEQLESISEQSNSVSDIEPETVKNVPSSNSSDDKTNNLHESTNDKRTIFQISSASLTVPQFHSRRSSESSTIPEPQIIFYNYKKQIQVPPSLTQSQSHHELINTFQPSIKRSLFYKEKSHALLNRESELKVQDCSFTEKDDSFYSHREMNPLNDSSRGLMISNRNPRNIQNRNNRLSEIIVNSYAHQQAEVTSLNQINYSDENLSMRSMNPKTQPNFAWYRRQNLMKKIEDKSSRNDNDYL